jgi:hypothetical protein
MIAHMNGLHLSDNFQPHNIHLEDEVETEEGMESYNVNLSPRELEQRLKSASRITVCEELKKTLNEGNEIIPKILLDRIERPCQALILWRPPDMLPNLMTVYERKASDSEEEMDSNNNNNSMDMDL